MSQNTEARRKANEELRKEIEDMKIERMKSPVKAATPINASAADNNTLTAIKPVDTTTTFKVDTQGDYKARISQDGTTTTLELLLNGPATVQVHTLNELIAEGSSNSASVPSGGIAAPVGGSATTATGSAVKEKKEKVREMGESDEDVGFSLFD